MLIVLTAVVVGLLIILKARAVFAVLNYIYHVSTYSAYGTLGTFSIYSIYSTYRNDGTTREKT